MASFFEDTFSKIVGQLQTLFQTFSVGDILDIIVISLLIFELILLVRHTRAAQLVKGIVLLLIVYALVVLVGMRTMRFVLDAIISFGVVVLAVIFQPELRRAIEQVGGINSLFARIFRPESMDETRRAKWKQTIVSVCDAAERMGEERTGALIVLERHTNLVELIRTGTALHSDVSVETLMTIFYEGTPLHDGATILRDGQIEAAGCILPLSNNLEISKDLGTRHRSALGLSENSDAIVVVVSEETGIISLAKNGVMIRRLDRQNLFSLLVSEMIPPEPPAEKKQILGRKPRAKKNEQETK